MTNRCFIFRNTLLFFFAGEKWNVEKYRETSPTRWVVGNGFIHSFHVGEVISASQPLSFLFSSLPKALGGRGGRLLGPRKQNPHRLKCSLDVRVYFVCVCMCFFLLFLLTEFLILLSPTRFKLRHQNAPSKVGVRKMSKSKDASIPCPARDGGLKDAFIFSYLKQERKKKIIHQA